jgi:uncharacterized protein YvpB
VQFAQSNFGKFINLYQKISYCLIEHKKIRKGVFILKKHILEILIFLALVVCIISCNTMDVYADNVDDFDDLHKTSYTIINEEENEKDEEFEPTTPFDGILSLINKSYFSRTNYGASASSFLSFTKKSSLFNETITEVPLYNQCDYPYTPYGNYGTISSHGCGIVSLSMVATYLLDEVHDPETLAKQFGHYNTEHGSYWILFEDSAKELGLDLQERTGDTEKVVQALANGQVVISLQSTGLFTSGGHFIVLVGLTEDGKIIVNDPYGRNYTKNGTMMEGFANGFTEKQIFQNGGPYWIYSKKELKLKENDANTMVDLLMKMIG